MYSELGSDMINISLIQNKKQHGNNLFPKIWGKNKFEPKDYVRFYSSMQISDGN